MPWFGIVSENDKIHIDFSDKIGYIKGAGGTYQRGALKLIDKNSKVPLYCQLMQILIHDIENNLPRDARLPSEREICEKYDLSRSTVRQAFQELERDGYIYKLHGKGTFVSPKKFNQDLLKFYSFTNEMKKKGKEPGSKVVEFELLPCSDSLSAKMKLETGTMIYRFVRIRLADGEPVMVDISYVPAKRFAGLTKEDLNRYAMYDIFARRFAVDITYAEEKFQAVQTDEKIAGYLKIDQVIPCLKIERFTYEKDLMIEYTITLARGDQFVYSIKLDKKDVDETKVG